MELIFNTLEIDILPTQKLIFTTLGIGFYHCAEIDFYHCRN